MSNFRIRNEEVEGTLKELGKFMKEKMPKGWGFTLFMFDYGKIGSMFYVSSSRRDDMVKAMKEFISRQENDETN